MGAVTFKDMVRDVLAFHQRFGSYIGDPTDPKIFNGDFRAKFIREESKETIDALFANDAAGAIDGICDTLYVTIGSAIEFGINVAEFPFYFLDEPTPTADLFDRKGLWAAEIRRVCGRCADLIDAGESIPLVKAALCGVLWLLNLTVLAWGLDVRPFWDEVQRANLEKVPSGAINKKTVKPPGWRGPDHAPILRAQYGLSGLSILMKAVAS